MDESEKLRISCPKCKNKREGTYKELFGDIPSLTLLPKITCKKCKVQLVLEFLPIAAV